MSDHGTPAPAPRGDTPLGRRIREEMQAAWRAGDTARRDTLRLVIAALENARIELGHEPDDDEALRVLQREAKQRRESIEQYGQGGRPDLVAAEEAELSVIAEYLPQALTDAELDAVLREVMAEVGAASAADLGAVMRPAMERVAGRADGARVNRRVRELLAG